MKRCRKTFLFPRNIVLRLPLSAALCLSLLGPTGGCGTGKPPLAAPAARSLRTGPIDVLGGPRTKTVMYVVKEGKPFILVDLARELPNFKDYAPAGQEEYLLKRALMIAASGDVLKRKEYEGKDAFVVRMILLLETDEYGRPKFNAAPEIALLEVARKVAAGLTPRRIAALTLDEARKDGQPPTDARQYSAGDDEVNDRVFLLKALGLAGGLLVLLALADAGLRVAVERSGWLADAVDIQTPAILCAKLDWFRRFAGYKVALIGDSVVFGHSLAEHGDRLWRQHNLAPLLKERIRRQRPHDAVLVMNLGLNGGPARRPGPHWRVPHRLRAGPVGVRRGAAVVSADFTPPKARYSRPWLAEMSYVPGRPFAAPSEGAKSRRPRHGWPCVVGRC